MDIELEHARKIADAIETADAAITAIGVAFGAELDVTMATFVGAADAAKSALSAAMHEAGAAFVGAKVTAMSGAEKAIAELTAATVAAGMETSAKIADRRDRMARRADELFADLTGTPRLPKADKPILVANDHGGKGEAA